MKELTIEEKAKRFDEALAMAKECITYLPDDAVNEYMLNMFPELAKSEDEKISKEIAEFINGVYEQQALIITDEEKDSWIAWLEKQGKQKPVDKVEPKFKAGNWYQCTKDFFGKGVTFDKNTAYYCAKDGCLQCEYGCHIAIVKDLYDNFKLWNIFDAKEGDMLADNGAKIIFIFKNTEYDSYIESNVIKYYIRYSFDGINLPLENGGHLGVVGEYTNFVPATQEQRDLLFQKMKEAGYEWNAEKKELKKLGQPEESKTNDQDKTEWSEEDECFLEDCIDVLYSSDEYGTSRKAKIENWLDSLKARTQPQNQWKPSDEQMDALETAVSSLQSNILESLYQDLKNYG